MATVVFSKSNFDPCLKLGIPPVKLLRLVLAELGQALQTALQLILPKKQRDLQRRQCPARDLGPSVEHGDPAQLPLEVLHRLIGVLALFDGHGTGERDLRVREDTIAGLCTAVGAAGAAAGGGEGGGEGVDAADEVRLLLIGDLALDGAEEEVKGIREAVEGVAGDELAEDLENSIFQDTYRS